MIASMTGYGVAEGKLAQNIIKVEIRSLNSRYFDFSSRLPLAVTPFEGDIKKCVHARLKRGKINLSIMVNNVAEATAMITLDEKKLLFYMKELKRFGKKHGIRGELELKDLFSFPDLFICEQKKTSETTLKRCILDTVGRAVRNLAAMRLKEGAHTVKDLRLRVRTMERAVLHKTALLMPLQI